MRLQPRNALQQEVEQAAFLGLFVGEEESGFSIIVIIVVIVVIVLSFVVSVMFDTIHGQGIATYNHINIANLLKYIVR